MGVLKPLSLPVFLLVACLSVYAVSGSTAGNRKLLENNDVADAFNDAKEGVISFKKGFWGGSCTSLEQCTDYIATCGDQGECRPSWWVWMILAFIVLSLIASCICCICHGICSCILDCICCCR